MDSIRVGSVSAEDRDVNALASKYKKRECKIRRVWRYISPIGTTGEVGFFGNNFIFEFMAEGLSEAVRVSISSESLLPKKKAALSLISSKFLVRQVPSIFTV